MLQNTTVIAKSYSSSDEVYTLFLADEFMFPEKKLSDDKGCL